MEHPNSEKLERYAARQLSASEMTATILHLENCAVCSDTVKNFNEDQEISLFAENESENFHLDYDEHLRPFVDSEADEVTREIVESHTQICSNCAFQLRELREFSESLRLREIEKNLRYSPNFFDKISGWLQRFSPHTVFQIVLPLLLLMFGIVAVIWFVRKTDEKNTEITGIADERKIESQTIQMPVNSGEINKEIVGSFNRNTEKRAVKNENSANSVKVKNSVKTENEAAKKESLTEIETLPNDVKITVQKALNSKKIAFPEFLAAIRENINLRGDSDKISRRIYPKGEAVREAAPQFRWGKFALSGEKYIVEIFDEQNNSVEISPPLRAENWKPKAVLQRGKNYSWEVRTPNSSATGKFTILENAEIIKINRIRTKSAIARGIIFASNGLLKEAESEFKKAVKNRENPALARKFLKQIENPK